MNIAKALAAARALGIDRLDAQLLLAHELQRERPWLLAHDDYTIDAPAWQHIETTLKRRAAGEPLAYLVGHKEFHGLALQVDARVLVPRPDTEVLVDWALELLRKNAQIAPAVVDLGTGSGAIALAVKRAHPHAQVTATDASPAALEVAQGNARQLRLALEFRAGSWWTPLAGWRFSLALSNPPYIAAADPHLAALRSEPIEALTPGPCGLEALQAIVAGAPAHLLPGGWLLLEHGFDQAEAVRALLCARGFRDIATRQDLAGRARCTGGHL
jgi:release factor glutamine methyltransferase